MWKVCSLNVLLIEKEMRKSSAQNGTSKCINEIIISLSIEKKQQKYVKSICMYCKSCIYVSFHIILHLFDKKNERKNRIVILSINLAC